MSSVNKKPVGRPKKRSRSMAGTQAMSNPGRPRKINMHDVSYSTLNRRAHEMAEQYDVATLQMALDIAKKNANYVDEPEEGDCSIIRHSNESAFALFLENDFSVAQWDRLVNDSKKKNAPIYPTYYQLEKVKSQCRPKIYCVENEMCVQVSFQIMLDLTAERIVSAVGTGWPIDKLNDIVLICAYGFDSSSGFKNPHQRYDDVNNVALKSEQSLFASTFTLVGLMTSQKTRLWLNPTPQSIRFCRPLRIAVEKETEENVMAEKHRLDAEIAELHPHSFSLPDGKTVTVNYDAYFTMLDGKCLNFVVGNRATVRCPVCNITMDNFNEECDWNAEIPKANLRHGIANLHCEIKTMEQLIKLSARLELHTWTVSKEMRVTLQDELTAIQTKLFDEFFIRVNMVQHGAGTSMNGNAARTCFRDPTKLAITLGIDEELVKRLSFVILAFKQKEGVNLEKLEIYCNDTYKRFYEIYPWAKFNPTVHKMLRHGVAIAREFPLSLAYFAEDSAESMHKYYRKNGISHARQNSRANRLKDVFNRSVDLSDPLISTYYLDNRCESQNKNLPSEFKSLFYDEA